MALLLVAAAIAAAFTGGLPRVLAQDTSVTTVSGNSLQYPTYFNWTLYDTSAMFDYFPSYEASWNKSFTQSPWSKYERGQAGIGVSSHSANSTYSPSILFNLPMTEFYMYGRVKNIDLNATDDLKPLSLIVDSRNPMNVTPSDGLICYVDNLLWGSHKVQLTLYSGEWEFTGIRIVTGASTTAPIGNVTRTEAKFVTDDGTLNDFFDYSDGWEVKQTIGGAGDQTPVNYTHISGAGPVSTNLTIPSGTAWVALYGAVGPDSTEFTLVWDPLPPLSDSDMRFASNNPWQAESTFYVAPLLPEVNYTLQIVGSSDNQWSTLALHSLVFYHQSQIDSNPEQSSSSNAGAIAGGVVGGVVGLALIGLLVWWLWRRRRQQATAQGSKGSSSTDETVSEQFEMDDMPEPSPFVPPPQPPSKVADTDLPPTAGEGGMRRQQLSVSTAAAPIQQPGVGMALSPLPTSAATSTGVPSFMDSRPTPGVNSRLLPANPDAGYSPSPTTPHSGVSTPIHPMAAELKLGSSRRPRPPPRTRQVEQEMDGGAIVSDDIELVPPVYNPEWARGRSTRDVPLSPIDTSGVGGFNGSPTHSPSTPTTFSSLHNPSLSNLRPSLEAEHTPHSSPITPATAGPSPSETDHLRPTSHAPQ